jgi:alkyl hydroperoxide reductase subunit F
MLDAALKTQLAGYLAKLTRPVEVAASLDASIASRELRGLLQEIAGLSAQVQVVERDDGERAPSFSIGTPGEAARIRFAGIPLGHEFSSLVLALLQVGGHPPRVDAATIEAIRTLPGDETLQFETYLSLSCQNCPEVVQALNLLALLNPRVSHVAIDGALYPDEVEARKIMAVPSVFLNGRPFVQGRISIDEVLGRLDRGSGERAAGELAAKAPFDLLVVGGGPAGAAAALYAARKGIRSGIVAERFGGQVLDTLGIENFISVPQTEGPRFAAALEQHVRQYDVDIINLQRAQQLVPGDLIEVRLASGATLRSRAVVLAPGARWREVDVPGEKQYRNRGVAYCPHCDGPLFKSKRVAVIGGGNSGVEAAIDLAGLAAHVTLLEFGPALRADAVLLDRLESLANVTVQTQAQTTEITGDGERVRGLRYIDRASGAAHDVALDGVFVQIGLVANTEWLKGTIALNRHGEIEVDARGQTSVPGVFAAGDATTTPFKQIVIAAGDGAKAALGAFDHLIRTPVATP